MGTLPGRVAGGPSHHRPGGLRQEGAAPHATEGKDTPEGRQGCNNKYGRTVMGGCQ
jgi:hypothetical protein